MDYFIPRGLFSSEKRSPPLSVQDLLDSLPGYLSVLVNNLKPYSRSVSLQRRHEGTSRSEEWVYNKLSLLREEEDEFPNQRLGERSRVADLLVPARLRPMDKPGLCEFYPFCAGQIVESIFAD